MAPRFDLRRTLRAGVSRVLAEGIYRGWLPSSLNPYPQAGHSLHSGGLVNPTSGMGGLADKSQASFFTPTRIHWQGELEVLYAQSWAAARFIDIPIDDMFAKWRQWDMTQDETGARAMMEVERTHRVRSRLARAMKAGRLYGTGLLVMVSREAPLEQELMIRQFRPGDLIGLQYFHRYNASVAVRDEDIYSPTYGEPLEYRIAPAFGMPFNVHRSRVLRFDGRTPLSSSGYMIYDRDWGVSEIIAVLTTILQDEAIATAIAHLTQEASLPVLRIDGLKDALVGMKDPSEPSAEQIGNSVNMLKSVFRILMLDKTDEFDRIAVNFGGLSDIQDRIARRLAAAAGIPATRFWGQSPVGMNATGESDTQNHSQNVAAMQQAQLPDPLEQLDEVLAADAGVSDPPEHTWPPLTEPTEEEQANAAHTRAQALEIAQRGGAIDEDEFRASINGTPVFGHLPGEAPGLPEPDLPPEPGSGGGGGGGGGE